MNDGTLPRNPRDLPTSHLLRETRHSSRRHKVVERGLIPNDLSWMALDFRNSSRAEAPYTWSGIRRASRAGFSLIEMLVTLILLSISLAAVMTVFANYLERTTAQRAAQVFAMDLRFARTTAVRGREIVVVNFDEGALSYIVRLSSGDTLVNREFEAGQDIVLDVLDLQMSGDSLVFDTRGVVDLSGAGSSLGVARFTAGDMEYDVSFNSMGASRVAIP